MFSGYFLNDESIPVWLSWLKYISFIRYAFQALAVNEFRGAHFDCPALENMPTTVNASLIMNSTISSNTYCLDGNGQLGILNFEDISIANNAAVLLALIIGFNGIAYWAVLVLRKPTFVKMAATKGGVAPQAQKANDDHCVEVLATPATAIATVTPVP